MISYKQNSSLLEQIPHITQSRPFSFHHTIVPPCTESVLYLHWHSEIEFLYIEHGKATFCVEGLEYHLNSGDAIFVPQNLLHMAKGLNDSDCEFYAIVFSTSFLLDSYKNPHYAKYLLPITYNSLPCTLHLTPVNPWHKNILNNLSLIFNISLADNLTDWELHLQGMLLIIWQELYNNHLSKIRVPKNFSRLIQQLETSLNYIYNSYADEITLEHLAGISNLSKGQFCRLFKQLTGYRPFSYLHRYRVLKSCEFLMHTQKKVTEIATLCGFNNISYYNREFIKIMKITPSAYRKATQ
jgi:AraC-like DNA-binding protein/mannose-6-phosphate isomerase-like protein (cupin superfamily)